jgi:uncharacterized membrane protein YkgB
MYVIVRKISGFSWSAGNNRLSAIGVVAAIITLWARLKLPEPWATLVGGTLALSTGVYCLKVLIQHVGLEKIYRYLDKIRAPFRSHKQPAK